MFGKIIKGDRDYLKKKRNRVIITTIIFFAISIAIFAVGYITTGTKRNLLTVVAILGCLPSCKSAVSMIMYIKAKGCSLSKADMIAGISGDFIGMYDMYFTSYDKNFAISHMIVNKKVLICFYEDQKFNKDAFKEHIETMMKRAGHSNIVVSVTNDIEKYCHMLSDLDTNLTDSEIAIDDEIRISLYEICL